LVFYEKTGSNRFGSVFQFGSVFFGLARFFSIWVRFSFRFQTYKTETEPNRPFFQNFNWFFPWFGFFDNFFSGLIGFSVFFLTLYHVSLCHKKWVGVFYFIFSSIKKNKLQKLNM